MSLIWQEILIRPIFNLLIFFYNFIPFHDLGIAIILVTAILKLILFPSSLKLLKHQKMLQKLQPEIEKIRKNHKDKQQQTQAIFQLYREKKINPLYSCLPFIFQIVLLIALFQVLSRHLPAGNFSLLYPFIRQPSSLNTYFLGFLNLVATPKITSLLSLFTLYKWNLLLALIVGILQIYQSRMILPKGQPTSPQAAVSKQMTYLFPVIVVFFSLFLPAGLPLSWLVMEIFTITSQKLALRERSYD